MVLQDSGPQNENILSDKVSGYNFNFCLTIHLFNLADVHCKYYAAELEQTLRQA